MSDNREHANFSTGTLASAQPKRSGVPNFEHDQTLAVLFDVTRELTSILARDELLQRIADRVKKLVNYHLFMVMVWNENSSHLECAFAKHYEEPIAVELSVSLFKESPDTLREPAFPLVSTTFVWTSVTLSSP
jgi:hypothetical protein